MKDIASGTGSARPQPQASARLGAIACGAQSARWQRRLDETLALVSQSAAVDAHNHETFTLLAAIQLARRELAHAKATCARVARAQIPAYANLPHGRGDPAEAGALGVVHALTLVCGN